MFLSSRSGKRCRRHGISPAISFEPHRPAEHPFGIAGRGHTRVADNRRINSEVDAVHRAKIYVEKALKMLLP